MPKPTTPVASHTVTNTDGSTVKQTYQPQVDSSATTTPPAPTATPSTNLPINGSDNGSTVDSNGNVNPGTPDATPTPPTPTVFSQAQTGLLNRANGQESPQVTAMTRQDPQDIYEF